VTEHRLRIAAGVLAAALFTVLCMWLGMRVAGPVTQSYSLGTVQFYVDPSWIGKTKVYLPLAGWEIEAPVFSAPYALHAQPGRVSVSALRRAAHGVKPALKTAKKSLKHAAILTFIRSLLFALLGALAAGAIVMLVLRVVEYPWRTALITGACCLGFGFVVVATSGLWLWQSVDIKAFRQSKVVVGNAKALTRIVNKLRNARQENGVVEDLSQLVERGDRSTTRQGRP
jgi:hypothetical protein